MEEKTTAMQEAPAQNEKTVQEEFLEIYNTNVMSRPGADKLLAYLKKSDFFEAPASTKYHLCVPGGLLKNSVNVYRRLRKLVMSEASAEFNPSEETIAIVSLLHDLCKVQFYKKARKSRKTGEYYPNGKPIWEDYDSYEIEDNLPYGHGEKSVYIISGYIRLTREEAMAIRWHMGAWEDDNKQTLGKAFQMHRLAVLLHIADMQATYLDEAV